MSGLPLDLNEITTFIEVTRHMSLSAAARVLRVSTATVSRRITRLEERLGIQLLDRTTRGLTLTEAGEAYADRAGRGLAMISGAEEQLQHLTGVPQGVLRVAAPTSFIQHRLSPVANAYAAQYPQVELHVIEADYLIDMDEADVHIAIQVIPQSKWDLQGPRSRRALMRRTLDTYEMCICVSPEYLASHGPIRHPSDLRAHQCIVLGKNPSARHVRFFGPDGEELHVEVGVRVFTTNVALCQQAAIAGLGPVGLTWPDCRGLLSRGTLVRVLEDWRLEPVKCMAVFVGGPRPPQRTRAFLDLLAEA